MFQTMEFSDEILYCLSSQYVPSNLFLYTVLCLLLSVPWLILFSFFHFFGVIYEIG